MKAYCGLVTTIAALTPTSASLRALDKMTAAFWLMQGQGSFFGGGVSCVGWAACWEAWLCSACVCVLTTGWVGWSEEQLLVLAHGLVPIRSWPSRSAKLSGSSETIAYKFSVCGLVRLA